MGKKQMATPKKLCEHRRVEIDKFIKIKIKK